MAANSRPSSASGSRAPRRDAVVVVDRLSKLYPGRPVTMFPPVVSMLDRDLFKRKSSDSDSQKLRVPAPRDDREDEDEDEEDEEDEEFQFDEHRPPPRARPDEDFWALRDVSFRVPAGGALGVLGGPASGKSTLLSILGGHALPTEGRALVRDPVSPVPARLMRALRFSDKGTFDFDLVFGSRLVGLPGRLTKPLEQEIMKLAEPLFDEHGDPVRGWALRVAIATSVVLPGNVLLLEEEKVMTAEFTARMVERVRERLRSGTALVLASRTPALVRELCDEVIVLDEGKVVQHGPTQAVLRHLESAPLGAGNGADPAAPGGYRGTVWRGRKLRVPSTVTPFHSSAALRSVKMSAASGAGLKRVHESDEVWIEIEIETAVPDVAVALSVDFTPADGSGDAIRIEHPDGPLRLPEPGTRVVLAKTVPGAFPGGVYATRVDAVVSSGGAGRTVIARDADRVRIVSEGLGDSDEASLIEHWDGRTCRLAAARWSIE